MSLALSEKHEISEKDDIDKRFKRESLVKFAITTSIGLTPTAALLAKGTGTPTELATAVVTGLTAPIMYQYMRHKMAKSSRENNYDPAEALIVSITTAMPMVLSIIGSIVVFANSPNNAGFSVACGMIPFIGVVATEMTYMFKHINDRFEKKSSNDDYYEINSSENEELNTAIECPQQEIEMPKYKNSNIRESIAKILRSKNEI